MTSIHLTKRGGWLLMTAAIGIISSCAGDPVEPAPRTGQQYPLTAINGRSLPYKLPDFPHNYTIFAGSAEFLDGSKLRLTFVRDFVPGAETRDTRSETYRYTLAAGTIILQNVNPGYAELRGSWRGDTLVVPLQNVDTWLNYTFVRAR